MKKWFGLVGLFLSSYIAFLIATIPVALILNNVSIPKNIQISGAEGTVWNASVEQVIFGKLTLDKVSSELSFVSLLSLSPTVKLTFGDALLTTPEGELTLNISSEELRLSNVSLFMKANDVTSQLALPLPVTALGNVELNIEELAFHYQQNNFNTLECTDAKGRASWQSAGVIALEQNIKLGRFNASLTCSDKAIMLTVDPKNDLGLSFNLYARMNKRLTGDGFLKPGEKFPKVLESALPFLGNKNAQGQYLLRL
ncbi:MAG: type II secretion system protein N [Colwellia sp.]